MNQIPTKPNFAQTIQTDLLVIGGGAAGIRAAIEARRKNIQVLVISTSNVGSGNNSAISQGGFSAVDPQDPRDSLDLFYQDTFRAGYGLSRPFLVRKLVEGAWTEAKELETMGVVFQKDSSGDYIRVGRGGHSVPRRLATPTHNGMALLSPLWKYAQGIQISSLNGVKAVRLLQQNGQVSGALLVNRQSEWLAVAAKAIILATGGGGALFPKHNNVPSATGEGYVLAYEAGLPLQDLEFVQFTLKTQKEPGIASRIPPIEFLLLHGAVLRNPRGQSLEEAQGRKLALTRDALTRNVAQEIRQNPANEKFILLDLKDLHPEVRREFSPLPEQLMKVYPAVHYFMGGVRVEKDLTTPLSGLFAAGEVMGGIQGANRLGGNALAEAFVFGSLAGSLAAQFVQKSGKEFLFQKHRTLQEWKQMVDSLGGTREGNLPELGTELQSILGECLGVIRHQEAMERGRCRFQRLKQTFAEIDFQPLKNGWEVSTLRSKILVAEMILQSALTREESRGAHVREDFPDQDDKNWLCNICVRQEKGRMNFFLEPVQPG